MEGSIQLLKDVAIVSQRWPAVGNSLSDMAGSDTLLSKKHSQKSKYASLIVDNINLNSIYDPQKEAKLQLKNIPKNATTAWVYGGGSPHQLETLLNRKPLIKLTWVILSIKVFYQSLDFYDFSSILQDPRLVIEMATPKTKVHFPFSVQTPCLYLADQQAVRLKDMLQLELMTPFLHQHQQQKYDEWVYQQVKNNTDLLEQDGDISELYNSTSGEVIVCAAGPTLSDWLQNYRPNQEDLIVTVDAALGALLSKNIVPTVVVIIDPAHSMRELFEGDLSSLEHSWLAYVPEVYKKILLSWPGKRLAFYAGGGLIQDVVEKFPKSRLFAAGSVAHSAVDLAVKMGAERVRLVGFDFAHIDGNSHAKEVAIHSLEENYGDNRTVLNGYGEQIPTLMNLIHYLRDLESYISKIQEIKNM